MAGYITFQNDKHAQNHFASIKSYAAMAILTHTKMHCYTKIRIVNVNGMGGYTSSSITVLEKIVAKNLCH